MFRVYDRAKVSFILCSGLSLLEKEMQHVRLDIVWYAAMADAPAMGAT
jgi:hypothetical protein